MNYRHRQMASRIQQGFEDWQVFLDGLDGMARATVERGWTEEQARVMVLAGLIPRSNDTEDDT